MKEIRTTIIHYTNKEEKLDSISCDFCGIKAPLHENDDWQNNNYIYWKSGATTCRCQAYGEESLEVIICPKCFVEQFKDTVNKKKETIINDYR